MNVGTKVYWLVTDHEAYWKWKDQGPWTPLHLQVPEPKTEKHTGVLATAPERVMRANHSEWVCLVVQDSDGKVVEKDTKTLYVVPRELPL